MLSLCINRYKKYRNIKRFHKHYQINANARLFRTYYADSDGFSLSKSVRTDNHDPTLTYGEIEFDAFACCLSLTSPKPSDHFYDLGAGTGKACLTAAMIFHIKHATGIECLAPLYHESVRIKHKLPPALQNRLTFRHDLILNTDLSPATLIFMNATGFFGDDWHKIVQFLTKYSSSGTRIILTSKSLPESHFHLMHQTRCQMSWGAAHIRIYTKI